MNPYRLVKTLLFFFVITFLSCNPSKTFAQEKYDLIVYGGTSSGIVSAIQAKKMGKSVLIIEPSSHIGGLTTGGLGATDIGNKQAIGGLSRAFYEKVYQHYSNDDSWKFQTRLSYFPKGQKDTSQWTFEPHVTMKIFKDWISEYEIELVMNERLNLSNGVTMKDNRIVQVHMESGKSYSAKMFIDATYEGDLMALSNVSYTFGRESNEEYGETLNGIQTQYGIYHQFPDGVSPYVIAGDSTSGLLPNINPNIDSDGTGDIRIQGYCFRMCMTNVKENRIAVEKPETYDEKDYELLFRAIEAGYNGPFFIMSMMPNHKTDANNKGPFSTDFIGMNYDYPDGDYDKRDEIIEVHKNYNLGFLWTLSYHPRIPEAIRTKFAEWGLPKDEYVTNNNWSPQLYIREARRMVSDFVMTEHHCTQDSITAGKSIGMGAYTMDSHHMQRYVDTDGNVKNEGDVEVGGFSPYPISYKAIVPKKNECENLLVPVCLSATHIAFGSIRMEPVFMILGQSAATAACLAIDNNVSVQDVSYPLLEKHLLEDLQVLKQQP
jgi:hypothetical protein